MVYLGSETVCPKKDRQTAFYSPLLGGKILLRGQVNQFTDQKSSLVRKFTGDKIWWDQLIVEPVDYSAVVLVNIFFFVETVKFMKILQIVD